MTYDLVVGDPRTVARVINMAHRFQCRASRVDSTSSESVTTAHFEFSGDATQLDRLARANRSYRPIRENICIVKKTLFDKIWESHVVEELQGGNALIFVDLVVAHEITSPQGIIAIENDFGDKLYDPNKIVSR